MKILFLSQGKFETDHPGWIDALEKLKKENFISDFCKIPYLGYAEKHGWNSFYDHVVELCKKENFDIVYFHYFHRKGAPSPKCCIENIRKISPDSVILTSSGDAFANSLLFSFSSFNYPYSFKEASRYADITFSTQMGKAANTMMRWGANNIVLSPLAMCQVRFKGSGIDFKTHKFDFDAVFIGSKNSGKNFLKKYYYYTRKRTKILLLLSEYLGKRLGVFGKNWGSILPNNGPCPFDKQQDFLRKGHMIFDSPSFSEADYYTSNRIFIGVASGIPIIVPTALRLDKILRNNDHVYFVDDIDGIIDSCDRLLKMDPEELYTKAAKAAEYITERHTQYHRMKFKLDTAKRYLENNRKLDVHFPFFLDEVDLEEEKKYAIRSK